MEAQEKGRAEEVVDTAHCHCYSPLQKMATSIKSLMIPALCPGGVGEKGAECLSERERAGE